jgi:hypothetical protein
MIAKKYKTQMIVFLISVVLLSACTSQVGAISTVTSLPTVGEIPTTQVEVKPTATSLPMPSETAASHFEGFSTGLDNTAQARIRTISEVMGAPKTDVYVNSMPAFNGGIGQQNISAGQFSGWLYVTPGNYTIALVPHDGTMEQALFAPADLKLEAGHRYTVAAMGQLADMDIHPLIVDETALEAGLGAGISDTISIDINNLKGADSITEKAYGKTMAENIKYGEARAMFCASGSPLFTTLANNQTSEVIVEATAWAEPGTSFGVPWFGPYPASNYDSVDNVSQGTSELNVVDFLRGFDGRDVRIDGHLVTFSTFLTAIDKAGLHDQLVNSGPYFLMAPTDEAFDALSQSEKDALLSDPQALLKLLNAHIVDGYYPSGSLSGSSYGVANRTVTNRLGQELAFVGDNLNNYPIGPNYTVGNGNRVQIIYNLLPYK